MGLWDKRRTVISTHKRRMPRPIWHGGRRGTCRNCTIGTCAGIISGERPVFLFQKKLQCSLVAFPQRGPNQMALIEDYEVDRRFERLGIDLEPPQLRDARQLIGLCENDAPLDELWERAKGLGVNEYYKSIDRLCKPLLKDRKIRIVSEEDEDDSGSDFELPPHEKEKYNERKKDEESKAKQRQEDIRKKQERERLLKRVQEELEKSRKEKEFKQAELKRLRKKEQETRREKLKKQKQEKALRLAFQHLPTFAFSKGFTGHVTTDDVEDYTSLDLVEQVQETQRLRTGGPLLVLIDDILPFLQDEPREGNRIRGDYDSQKLGDMFGYPQFAVNAKQRLIAVYEGHHRIRLFAKFCRDNGINDGYLPMWLSVNPANFGRSEIIRKAEDGDAHPTRGYHLLPDSISDAYLDKMVDKSRDSGCNVLDFGLPVYELI